MSDRDTWPASCARVEKPGRYVGGEWNEIRKDPARVRTKVALAFPDVYEIGMSYLGQKILYGLLNRDRDVLAERVFAPWPDFERSCRAAGMPLASLENGMPSSRLRHRRLLPPLRAQLLERPDHPRPRRHPPDLGREGRGRSARHRRRAGRLQSRAGRRYLRPRLPRGRGGGLPGDRPGRRGPAPARRAAPRPAARAGQDRRASTCRPSTRPRPRGLAPGRPRPRGAGARGLRPQAPGRRIFPGRSFPEKIVVPGLRVVFDRVAVEAARGCPQNCRFCQATSLYFPTGPRTPAVVHRTALRSLRQTGYEDAVPLGSVGRRPPPARGDRPAVSWTSSSRGEDLALPLVAPAGAAVARSSSRTSSRSARPVSPSCPKRGPSVSAAVINKKLDDREIRDALTFAFEGGWRLVKLYFMVGLPTETDEDLAGIVRLVGDAVDLGRSILGRPRASTSASSSFIPKPHTPFQWLGMDDEDVLASKSRTSSARSSGGYRTRRGQDPPRRRPPSSRPSSRGATGGSGGVLVDAWREGRPVRRLGRQARPRRPGRPRSPRRRSITAIISGRSLSERPFRGTSSRPGSGRAISPGELEAALRAERTPGLSRPGLRRVPGVRRAVPGRGRPGRSEDRSAGRGPRPCGGARREILRYRAVYSKRGKARFLSHIDLIHVIHRSFRRAGIEVRKTEGFHPKMDFTYGPALPSGDGGPAGGPGIPLAPPDRSGAVPGPGQPIGAAGDPVLPASILFRRARHRSPSHGRDASIRSTAGTGSSDPSRAPGSSGPGPRSLQGRPGGGARWASRSPGGASCWPSPARSGRGGSGRRTSSGRSSASRSPVFLIRRDEDPPPQLTVPVNPLHSAVIFTGESDT